MNLVTCIKRSVLTLVALVASLSVVTVAQADAGSPASANANSDFPAPSIFSHPVRERPANLVSLPKPDSVKAEFTAVGMVEVAHYPGIGTIRTLDAPAGTVIPNLPEYQSSRPDLISPNSTCPNIYNTGQPQLGGDARPGGTMSVTNGSWFVCSQDPMGISKAWSNGMGGDSNVMRDADAGQNIYVDVTACAGEAGCAGARSNGVVIASSGGGGGGGPAPATVSLRVISTNPQDAGEAAVIEQISNATSCGAGQGAQNWNPSGATNGNFGTGIIYATGVYHYAIRCYNSAGNPTDAGTNPDLTVKAPPAPPGDTTPPTTPPNFHVTATGGNAVGVAWSAANDNDRVLGYTVYLNGGKVADVTSLTYSFTGLTCGTSYTLAVDAYDPTGNHGGKASLSAQTSACPPPSGGDTTPPSVPGGLFSSVTDKTAVLSWTASSDNIGVAGYGVYVGTTRVGSTTTTSFMVTGLACNTTYTLGVDAYDASGNRSGRASTVITTVICLDTPLFAGPGFSYMYDIPDFVRDLAGGITTCSRGYRKKQIHLEDTFSMGAFGHSVVDIVTESLDLKVCYSKAANKVEKAWDYFKDHTGATPPWEWMGWEAGTPQHEFTVNNSGFTVKLRGGVAICAPVAHVACGPTRHPWIQATFHANNTMERSNGVD